MIEVLDNVDMPIGTYNRDFSQWLFVTYVYVWSCSGFSHLNILEWFIIIHMKDVNKINML